MQRPTQKVRHRSRSSEDKSNVLQAKQRSPAPKEIAKHYEPTPDERAAAKAILAERSKSPRAKVEDTDGKTVVSLSHESQTYGHVLLMKGLATHDVEFADEILLQLARASAQKGEVNERELNFMLAVVKGIQPKDQLETMLAAQMAVVHSLTMDMAGRLNGIFTLSQLDITERALNKLARTFAAQLEALKRYRSNGEQKVTVEHVTVNEGGKAIVGNVTHGGRELPEKPETTP